MTDPETLQWFTQRPGSVDCAAVAIMNARLWQGADVNISQLDSLAKELGISARKDGVSGSDLDRWIRRKDNFGVRRVVQPRFQLAKSLLKDGSGLILRYIWEINETRGAHFVFVCPGFRSRPLITNPHRVSRESGYERFRYFSDGEFRSCFKRNRVGVRHYPWIWPIVAG